jgi:hypothetical protein
MLQGMCTARSRCSSTAAWWLWANQERVKLRTAGVQDSNACATVHGVITNFLPIPVVEDQMAHSLDHRCARTGAVPPPRNDSSFTVLATCHIISQHITTYHIISQHTQTVHTGMVQMLMLHMIHDAGRCDRSPGMQYIGVITNFLPIPVVEDQMAHSRQHPLCPHRCLAACQHSSKYMVTATCT